MKSGSRDSLTYVLYLVICKLRAAVSSHPVDTHMKYHPLHIGHFPERHFVASFRITMPNQYNALGRYLVNYYVAEVGKSALPISTYSYVGKVVCS